MEAGRTVPNELVRRIASMVKTRQNVVTVDREASEDEIKEMEAVRGRTLPRPQYIEEAVAQIEGIDALYPENDLRQLLVLNVEQELQVFEELKVDSLSSESLRRWNKWVNAIEPTLDRASSSIEAGRRLLRRQNLQPLQQGKRGLKALLTRADA